MNKYDAFISYRRAEGGFYMARLIRNYLESQRISAFMDLSELHSGQFDEQIYEAIENSGNVIIVLPENALDRCLDKDDWLKKEILFAMEKEKHIIPVWLNKFVWPEDLIGNLPENEREAFEKLKIQQAIKDSQDYFDAMLTLIVKELKGVKIPQQHSLLAQEDSPMASTERYFQENMIDLNMVWRVDFAFHAGSEWIFSIEKRSLLNKLIEWGIPVRILLNTPEAAESVAQYMRVENMDYISFEETLKKWQTLAERHPFLVQVRLGSIPLMRRYLSFWMKDEQLSTVNVKHYTYNNGMVNENYQSIFNAGARFFKLYRGEFEFLWSQATPCEKVPQTAE